jgi:hypothetical protein
MGFSQDKEPPGGLAAALRHAVSRYYRALNAHFKALLRLYD